MSIMSSKAGPDRSKASSAGSSVPTAQVPNSQKRLAAQRAEAAQARIAASQRRRRLTVVFSAIGTVLVVIVALIVVKVTTNGSSAKSGQVATAASQSVINAVTSVPPTVLDSVGVGTASAVPKAITAPALTADGKPRVLYVGAEYCPYCATERWAMVVALSRFGTFTGLGQTTSSPSDVYPSTATLTFHGASFTSSTISFTGKETESNQAVNGGYAPLDTLSSADQTILNTYDAPPYVSSSDSGSIPFVDIGGKYLISGASYDPGVLKGKTHAQIAAALSDPTSAIAKGADGTANLITAAICKITSNAPAAVCTSSAVTTATATLTKGS
jgi:hypothetical protein